MKFDSITSHKMPEVGDSVLISYPWGAKLVIVSTGGSFNDLSAVSQDFTWTFTHPAGEVTKGKFSAIGGLCGSLESCYRALFREVESRNLLTRATLFAPGRYRTVLMPKDYSLILAQNGVKFEPKFFWFDKPKEFPSRFLASKEINDAGNIVFRVSAEDFDSLTAV